jgi:hypothetical protein
LRNILSLLAISEQPQSKTKYRLLMKVDKRAKVVGLSGKHSPHQLSIFDVHALRSKRFRPLSSKRRLDVKLVPFVGQTDAAFRFAELQAVK